MMRVVSFPTCYTVTLASICAKTEKKKPFSRSLFSGSKPNRNRKWCCREFEPSLFPPIAHSYGAVPDGSGGTTVARFICTGLHSTVSGPSVRPPSSLACSINLGHLRLDNGGSPPARRTLSDLLARQNEHHAAALDAYKYNLEARPAIVERARKVRVLAAGLELERVSVATGDIDTVSSGLGPLGSLEGAEGKAGRRVVNLDKRQNNPQKGVVPLYDFCESRIGHVHHVTSRVAADVSFCAPPDSQPLDVM